MAGKSRAQTACLESELLEKGHGFSFFQAIRLLKSLVGSALGNQGHGVYASGIRIRPNLSLSFPKSDVEQIEKESETNTYTLTANLPGLYGTASPLPTFYTEDLFDDAARGETTVRDFLDVINQRLYELLFAGWGKYSGMQQIFEHKSRVHAERLFSLIGLGEDELREGLDNPYELLRYTGLFTIAPRSASGLETILSDALGGIGVTVIQAVEKKGRIQEDQMARLGESIQLGVNSQLGRENKNRTGSFRIEIGPVTGRDYEMLLPGNRYYTKLVALTELYVSQPLEYDIDVVMDPAEKPSTVCLGGAQWSSLGLTTWIFSDKGPDEFRSRFYPEKAA